MTHPWDQDIADVIAGRKRWAVIARRRIADDANHLYAGAQP